MVAFIYRILLIPWIALTCLALQRMEQEASGFFKAFSRDQRDLLCGHFLAFEANARAGLGYAQRLGGLDGAEEAVDQWVEDARPAMDCGEGERELYRQVNQALAKEYPNFWYRRSDAADEGFEGKRGD